MTAGVQPLGASQMTISWQKKEEHSLNTWGVLALFAPARDNALGKEWEPEIHKKNCPWKRHSKVPSPSLCIITSCQLFKYKLKNRVDNSTQVLVHSNTISDPLKLPLTTCAS